MERLIASTHYMCTFATGGVEVVDNILLALFRRILPSSSFFCINAKLSWWAKQNWESGFNIFRKLDAMEALFLQ